MIAGSNRRNPRVLARVSFAMAVAVVAGTAVVLGLSAALDATWDPRAAVILALAAMWLPQTLLSAARHRRH